MAEKRKALIAYVVIFLALVTVWYLILYPKIETLKGNYTVIFILLWFIGKTIIWIFPVFIYLRLIGIHNPLDFLKFKNNWVKGIGWGILLSLIWVALRVILFCVVMGDKTISFQIGAYLWIATLVSGFFEEISFRSVILQQLSEQITFWKANVISTIIFLAYHIPTWFVQGFPNLIPNCFSVIFLGLVWGYLFKKTKSIWTSTIFHILHNLSVVIGIG